MNVSRRCFLKFCSGLTAGAVLSPLPWKLLDDVSIWTQNGTWVAPLPQGPESLVYSTCTLCPGGCGLQVRRVGPSPVAEWGVSGHPLAGGRLCPVGLGAAQLRFHPARLRGAAKREGPGHNPWRLVAAEAATEEVGARLARLLRDGSGNRVGILDLRPGRGLSVLYREFLAAVGGGHYLTLPGNRELAAAALGDLLADPGIEPGYDFARAGTIISFGAPVFDGWVGSGPAPGLLEGRSGPKAHSSAHVIQVETSGSMNTSLADTWLPILPGTEASLALGLIHLIRKSTVGDRSWRPLNPFPENGFGPGFNDLVARHTPDQVATITGIKPQVLRATAGCLTRGGPAIAVGCGNSGGGPLGRPEELAIWALNLTLGSVGQPGGVVLRRNLAKIFGEPGHVPAESLWDFPNGSLDLLLVDGSQPGTALPQGLLRRKMSGPEALVVGMSAFAAGPATQADLVIPTAAPGEWLDDVPSQALAPQTSYSFSPAVAEPLVRAPHPADLLDSLAKAAGLDPETIGGRARHQEILRLRAETLQERGQGRIFIPSSGHTIKLTDVRIPGELDRILAAGGCWCDSMEETPSAPTFGNNPIGSELANALAHQVGNRLSPPATSFPLVIVLAGQSVTSWGGALPPVVNKLYRESNLRQGRGTARLNPASARLHRLTEGRPARLETASGGINVTVVLDESVMPGVVMMSSGPGPADLGDPENNDSNILEICGAGRRPVWRVERAALREV